MFVDGWRSWQRASGVVNLASPGSRPGWSRARAGAGKNRRSARGASGGRFAPNRQRCRSFGGGVAVPGCGGLMYDRLATAGRSGPRPLLIAAGPGAAAKAARDPRRRVSAVHRGVVSGLLALHDRARVPAGSQGASGMLLLATCDYFSQQLATASGLSWAQQWPSSRASFRSSSRFLISVARRRGDADTTGHETSPAPRFAIPRFVPLQAIGAVHGSRATGIPPSQALFTRWRGLRRPVCLTPSYL